MPSYRRSCAAVAIALLLYTAALAGAAPSPQPGDTVRGLHFQDLYYRDVALESIDDRACYVLFFFSNTCPVARRYMPRVTEIAVRYRDRGVQFIGVNASPADTLRDVAQHALDYGVSYPVVKDRDFSAVRQIGITRTPEIAILDRDFVLRYRGRVDDQYRLGGARPSPGQPDLINAIEALLNGVPIPRPLTQAEGCAVTFPMLPEPEAPITYAEQIRPLLAEYCVGCHASGGSTPLALDDYDAVAKVQDQLRRVIEDDRMPPWHAASENPHLAPHRLSYRQQHRLLNWIKGGCAPGEETLPPASPNHPSDSAAGDTMTFRSTGVQSAAESGGPAIFGLSPATGAAAHAKSVLISASHASGLLHARIEFATPDNPESWRELTGPLLPGQPFDCGEDAAILLPAGAALRLVACVRAPIGEDGSSAPRVQMVCRPDAPARLLQCVRIAVRPAAGREHSGAFSPGDGSSVTIHAATIAMYQRASVRLTARTGGGLDHDLLSIPAYDPRWPITYRFDGESQLEFLSELRATALNPGFLLWPGNEAPYPLDGPGALESAVYLYIAR